MESPDRADQSSDRGRLSSTGSGTGKAGTARLTGGAASVWGGADYERIAETFAPIHARLVVALAPRPGERFLDLACGTGGVALVAAGSGADVVGVDFSSKQLTKARAASAAAGLSIEFDEGNVQNLPYDDASFAAVASCFGVIFAPDRERAAAELTRVTQPAGRIAVTSWTDDDWDELGRSVGRESQAGEHVWAREDIVRDLLGQAFDLRFETGEWQVTADSPEELWELVSTSAPPLKAFVDGLDDDRREDVRRRYVEFFGRGELSRPYVLVLGTRR